MQTSWIVQTNVELESTSPAQLRTACASLELPYYGVSISAGATSLPDLPPIAGPVVFHGRNTLILRALEHPRWCSGIFFSPDNFQYRAYVDAYGDDMLNADATTASLDEFLAAGLPTYEKVFVRPVDDFKAFSGQVLQRPQLLELHRTLKEAGHGALRVAVSVVQEIDAEWRLFFVDGRVVSGSMYRPTGGRFLPPELIQFAESAARRWVPAPVFVMDVARAQEAWKIVECNCFNGSRFYSANVEGIVSAVSRFQEMNV